MSKDYTYKNSIPIAPLRIAALESCKDLAGQVNDHIIRFRQNDIEALKQRQEYLEYRGYDRDSYLVDCECPRFGSGEAKGVMKQSVRGADIYIMVDITNYSLTYKMAGYINHMSPDDHYQDLKRIIATSVSIAHRVNVIMPFLYESRQHHRSMRESLDCAMALRELVNMGVSNIITFDAHDPRVQNAIPLHGFDNFEPPYQFIKTLFGKEKDLQIDKDHIMVISPDEGAMNRAVFFANNLGVDMGMFYKRRDYSRVVDGRNPIVAHEYLGSDGAGKDMFITDDIIASGESMLDLAYNLRQRKARRVFAFATYAIFTNGLETFDKAYQDGIIDGVFGTNLTYRTEELKQREWFYEVDVSKYIAYFIAALHHDMSAGALIDPHEKIKALLEKRREEQSKQKGAQLSF